MAITQIRQTDEKRRPGVRTTRSLAELAHGPEAFQLLVEAVVDYAIYLIGLDGRVLTWNLGAERIKGYKAHEIVGRHFSVFYTREDVQAGMPERNLHDAADRGSVAVEGWRVRKDGSRFWSAAQISTLRDQNGDLFGYAQVTRDMTEAREAAERERQLAAERQGRALAEEGLRSRDRFLAIASHELKTPVASLQIAVESLLLSRDNGLLDGERIERGIERMDHAVKRLGSVLRELLDISSLERGTITFNYAEIELSRIAGEVVERFSGVEPANRIDARLEPVVVEGDPVRVEQVITNLIDNALKYSSPPDPVVVRVSATRRGAEIEVSDRGIGLTLDRHGGLFKPFARGANAAEVPGMGLGLYISSEIVERHGGQISTAPAKEGPGTTFTVTLPAKTPRVGPGAD